VPVSRTVGEETLVDEMVARFTHSCRMDYFLPGVAPTYRKIEVPLVVIAHFRDGKLAHEHICWDQARSSSKWACSRSRASRSPVWRWPERCSIQNSRAMRLCSVNGQRAKPDHRLPLIR
jgi:hypothetical protein